MAQVDLNRRQLSSPFGRNICTGNCSCTSPRLDPGKQQQDISDIYSATDRLEPEAPEDEVQLGLLHASLHHSMDG